MKRYVPGRMELVLFGAMAVVCATIVHVSPSRDYALALLTMPVFMVAAMLGLRRSMLIDGAAEAEADEDELL